MMLVQLPAMDNVPGLDRLSSFVLSDSLSNLTHQLFNPTLWLTVLATLVILSSIRAAILFFRPTPSTSEKSLVSIIPGVGVVQVQKGVKGDSSNRIGSTNGGVVMQGIREEKMSSWFWGLVKWDTLPAFPRRDSRAMSASETERGRWSYHQQQQGLRIRLPQGSHPRLPVERTCKPKYYPITEPPFNVLLISGQNSARYLSNRSPCLNGEDDNVTSCE
jgi:hypothetical protein